MGYSLVVGHLPGICEALGSVLKAIKRGQLTQRNTKSPRKDQNLSSSAFSLGWGSSRLHLVPTERVPVEQASSLIWVFLLLSLKPAGVGVWERAQAWRRGLGQMPVSLGEAENKLILNQQNPRPCHWQSIVWPS